MSDTALLTELAEVRQRLVEQIQRRVIGQQDTVSALLTAVFAGGHALLIGAPGVAKTLLVRTVAEALGWDFKRIQFTPDLMPSDITGTDILRDDPDGGGRRLEFVRGPVFANLILADEINRTPPKTQAALLEAMEEKAVTAGGTTRRLPDPFFVLATQNPIEQEGTYQLPEAQLDRFLLAIDVGYPSEAEERAIAVLDIRHRAEIACILERADFQRYRDLIDRIPVPEVAIDYAVRLIRQSRPATTSNEWVRTNVAWGAGPRAAQHLIAAARAHAALSGAAAADIGILRAVAPWVIGHRLVPSFQAVAAGIDGQAIVAHLLAKVSA